MRKSLLALLAIVVLETSALAVEKIRIGVPELNAQFLPLALAEKRGFFKEDGLQGEIIRINPTVALAALVSGELDYWTVIGNSVAAAIQGVKGIKFILDEMAERQPRARNVAPESFVDISLLQEIEQSGFFKQLWKN